MDQQQLGEKLLFRKFGLYVMDSSFFKLFHSSSPHSSSLSDEMNDTSLSGSQSQPTLAPPIQGPLCSVDASRFSFSKYGGYFSYISVYPETLRSQSIHVSDDDVMSYAQQGISRRVSAVSGASNIVPFQVDPNIHFIVFIFNQTGLLQGIVESNLFTKAESIIRVNNNNNNEETAFDQSNTTKQKATSNNNNVEKKIPVIETCRGGIGWINIGNEVEERLVIVLADGRVFLHDGIWRDGSKKLKKENFTVYNMFDEQGDNSNNKVSSFMEINMASITHSGIVLLTRTAYLIVGKFIQENNNGSERLKMVVQRWNNGRSIVADPFSQQILSMTVEDDLKNKEIRQVFCSTSDGGIMSINEDERAAEKNIAYDIIKNAGQSLTGEDNGTAVSARVILMAIQPSNRFIACFTDTGMVLVVDSALKRRVIEFNTNAGTKPSQMMWCGDDSVLLSWKDLGVLMVGPYGDWVRYAYNTPVVLANEIDGCHIFTSFQHEYLQRVPDYYNDIFRIGSFEPSAMLYDATEALMQGDPIADENVRGLRQEGTLENAIAGCIQAALFEFDVRKQQSLLKAATLGKSFLLREQERKSLSDAFVTACNTLRVLNTVRNEQVGLPITITQYKHSGGCDSLIKRLLSRNMHYLALKICEYLRIKTMKQEVLLDWACKYVRNGKSRNQLLEISSIKNENVDTVVSTSSSASSIDADLSSSQGYVTAQILPSIVPKVVKGEIKEVDTTQTSYNAMYLNNSKHILKTRDSDISQASSEKGRTESELSEDEMIYRDIIDRLRSYPDIPYAAIATEAEKAGRYELSVLLLSHEPINTTHIKALIRMNFIDVALQRALSVMDADLIQMAVLAGVNRFGEVNMKKKGSSNNSNNQELDDRGIRTFDTDKDEKFHAFFQTVRAYPYIVDLIVDIAKQRGNLKLMHYIYNLYHMKANASDLDIMKTLEEEDVDNKISQLEAARDELMREIVDIDKHDPTSYGIAESSSSTLTSSTTAATRTRSASSQVHYKKIINFGRTAFDSCLNKPSQVRHGHVMNSNTSQIVMNALGSSQLSSMQYDQLQETRYSLQVRTDSLTDEIILLNHQRTLEKSVKLMKNGTRLVGLPLVKTLELLVGNEMMKEADILSKEMKMSYQRWNMYKNSFLSSNA